MEVGAWRTERRLTATPRRAAPPRELTHRAVPRHEKLRLLRGRPALPGLPQHGDRGGLRDLRGLGLRRRLRRLAGRRARRGGRRGLVRAARGVGWRWGCWCGPRRGARGERGGLRRPGCGGGLGAAAVASLLAAVLAEIYLGNVCSCQEILRRSGRGQNCTRELGGACEVRQASSSTTSRVVLVVGMAAIAASFLLFGLWAKRHLLAESDAPEPAQQQQQQQQEESRERRMAAGPGPGGGRDDGRDDGVPLLSGTHPAAAVREAPAEGRGGACHAPPRPNACLTVSGR
jgi:hypothetical protein